MKPILQLCIHGALGLLLGLAINRTLRSPSAQPLTAIQAQAEPSPLSVLPAPEPLDPAAIAEAIRQLAGAPDRTRAKIVLEQRLLAQASSGGRSGIDSLIRAINTPDGRGATELGDLLVLLLERIAKSDPGAALTHIQLLSNAELRDSAFSRIARAWAKRDPKALFEFAKNAPPGIARSKAPRLAIQELSKIDPKTALDYTLDSKDFASNLGFGSVFNNWFHSDPAAAERWLLEDSSPNDRRRVHGDAIQTYIYVDPAAAIRFIDKFSADQDPESWRQQAIAVWATNDPDAALDALQKMPSEQVTGRLLRNFALNVAQDDPEKAAALGETLALTDPQANAAYLSGIIAAHPWDDPEGRSALAVQLPEGRWRREAFDDAVGSWFDKDEVAASSWLSSLQPSPSRDIAIWRFVLNLAPIDPESAAQWATSIQDPKRRKKSIATALESWKKIDPDGASAWQE